MSCKRKCACCDSDGLFISSDYAEYCNDCFVIREKLFSHDFDEEFMTDIKVKVTYTVKEELHPYGYEYGEENRIFPLLSLFTEDDVIIRGNKFIIKSTTPKRNYYLPGEDNSQSYSVNRIKILKN